MAQHNRKHSYARTHRPFLRPAAWVAAFALLAAACSASTTIQPTVETAASESTAVSEAQPTPAFVDPTPTPPSPTPAVETPVTETSPDDALPDSVEIVLLNAGTEPRAELRLVIAASCGEILTVEQTQAISQTMGGVAIPANPAVGTIIETAVTVRPSGDAYDVRSEILSATVAPGINESLAGPVNAQLEAIVGLSTWVTITDRGVQVADSFRIEGAEALGPLQSTLESLSQVQAPFPVEPVGVGARWRTISTVDFGGAELINITEYRIIAIDGTIITLDAVGTQEIPVGSEIVLEGFEVEVAEWTGTSAGQTVIDLATISPVTSTLTGQAAQSMDFGAAGGGLLEQEISTDVVLRGEANDGCTGRTIRP